MKHRGKGWQIGGGILAGLIVLVLAGVGVWWHHRGRQFARVPLDDVSFASERAKKVFLAKHIFVKGGSATPTPTSIFSDEEDEILDGDGAGGDGTGGGAGRRRPTVRRMGEIAARGRGDGDGGQDQERHEREGRGLLNPSAAPYVIDVQ